MILQILKGRLCSLFIEEKLNVYHFTSFEIGIVLASSILLILSGLDGVMTLWGLSVGVIEEANPIMRAMISKSPSGVIVVKLLLPVMLGVLCWLLKDRSERLIKYSLGLVLVIYLSIDIVHLYWWTLLM